MVLLSVLPYSKIMTVFAIIHVKHIECEILDSKDLEISTRALQREIRETIDMIKRKEENNFQFIVPGTKWCGAGNIAKDYDDLGFEELTDKCCREHDNCKDIIPGNGKKHGLINDLPYTTLNCECDEKFHECLQKSTEFVTGFVANVYFNYLPTKCFRLDYPIVNCTKPTTKLFYLLKNCLEYTFDTSKPKKYQWFDVPLY